MKRPSAHHLLMILLLVPLLSLAQQNFQPGYIVKAGNDTLRGYIDYRNWDKNPTSISFRENDQQKPQSFKPSNISVFGMFGEHYLSAIVKIDKSPYHDADINFNKEFEYAMDTAFVRVLIAGNKSLLYLKDNEAREHFLINTAGGIESLWYKRFLEDDNGRKIISENRLYLQQLATYLGDCATIKTQLVYTRYATRDIKKVFDYYASCTNSVAQYQAPTSKATVNFGIIGGVAYIKASLDKENSQNYTSVSTGSSTRPVIGLTANIVLDRNRGKVSVINELYYASSRLSSMVENYTDADIFTRTNTTVNSSLVRMNNMMRYRFPVGKLFIDLNAGFSWGLSLPGKYYTRLESKFYSDNSITETNGTSKAGFGGLGVTTGIGLQMGHFSINFRNLSNRNISFTPWVSNRTTGLIVYAGYTF